MVGMLGWGWGLWLLGGMSVFNKGGFGKRVRARGKEVRVVRSGEGKGTKGDIGDGGNMKCIKAHEKARHHNHSAPPPPPHLATHPFSALPLGLVVRGGGEGGGKRPSKHSNISDPSVQYPAVL